MLTTWPDAGATVRCAAAHTRLMKSPGWLDNSLKNFNADPKREFVRERDKLRAVLDAAW